jgi:hypothetical protein
MPRELPNEADLAAAMDTYMAALGRDIAQVLRREGVEIGPWLRGADPTCTRGPSDLS